MCNNDYNEYYSESEVRSLLRKLPLLISSTLTPKNSMKSLASRDAKVYTVRHSTHLLDLILDLSLAWEKLPSYFKIILAQYYLYDCTDSTIGDGYSIPAKSIHRVRMKAVQAIVDVMCKGDFELMEKLKDFKRKPRKQSWSTEKIVTRVWRAE